MYPILALLPQVSEGSGWEFKGRSDKEVIRSTQLDEITAEKLYKAVYESRIFDGAVLLDERKGAFRVKLSKLHHPNLISCFIPALKSSISHHFPIENRIDWDIESFGSRKHILLISPPFSEEYSLKFLESLSENTLCKIWRLLSPNLHDVHILVRITNFNELYPLLQMNK